eukprot:gb/GECG01016331.1/.p1 GENE.gb/GECG01016331.1/~~gb/GECG01016331.1/.p1  ORF type:complete len:187 (+),score=21.44 gb/GECG01016331.1/:1-561(+)
MRRVQSLAVIRRCSALSPSIRGSLSMLGGFIPSQFTTILGRKPEVQGIAAFHTTPRSFAENESSNDEDDDVPTMNTEELKQLLDTKPDSFTFIDVRSDEEIFETGPFFKEAKQIPVEEVPRAFEELEDDDFFDEYGFDKPSKDDHVVFSCRAGVRSHTAAKVAKQNGYQNATNYVDGAAGWFNLPT